MTCDYSDENQGDTKAESMFFGQAALFFLLIEAFTLFVVIGEIGFFKTFIIWLCSAALGVLLIQRQGMVVLLRAQGIFERGAVPVDDLFDGLCLVIAGLLLLAPGFISDAFAFLLLIPFFRNSLRKKYPDGLRGRTARKNSDDDSVIDGTYVRVEETMDAIEQKPEDTISRKDF